jgi:hypothetical protein
VHYLSGQTRITPMKLAHWLAEHRMTQTEFAARLGVTRATVSFWVEGRPPGFHLQAPPSANQRDPAFVIRFVERGDETVCR